MIKYYLSADGGFTCGDTATGFTAYAYPTSTHAVRARKYPSEVAAAMLAGEKAYYRSVASVRDHDRLNWRRLNDAPALEAIADAIRGKSLVVTSQKESGHMASKKDILKTEAMLTSLQSTGISRDDAESLRRISMTLHRWHELECGDSNDYSSWCITRGRKAPRHFTRDPETQAGVWTGGEFAHDESGSPWIERHAHDAPAATYVAIPDRETGARKRLAKIMARYPTLRAYVQGDPRGCALYILRPGDVPEGADVSSYYSRGLAVFK